MTTEQPTGPKQAKTNNKKTSQPAHTIRAGALAASIWLRQTQTGLPYYEYSLSRSFKSITSGKAGYTSHYFARNEAALVNVIRQASQWIADAEAAADSDSDKRAA